MAKNRILYGLFLLAAVIFHSFYTGWFSFFLLVFAVLLPVFSLLVSLPAMLRAAYEAELPARCFCGQTVQYRLTARHMAKLPVSRCRLRLTVSDAVGGEVRQQRLELAGTLGFALRIDTRHAGVQTFQPGKGRVCDALGLFSLPLRLPDACSIAVEPEPQEPPVLPNLAHDLRTPLASVVGYLSLLQEAPDLPVEQRAHFTGVALDKAHRLDALIEEFFDITRFDFHDIVLTRGYVDLGLLLAQVADEFYPILNEQHKDVQVDVREDLTVLVDGDKMARVFNNIMKNAIAYSYEGSTITIEAGRQDDGGVQIRFINQGDPIPAAKLKVIFEKFYRLDAARATNRGGAGLGLAIAKEIVAAHSGTIACESTPEHTVFTIALPAA